MASEKVLDKLEGEGRVVFRYRDNPNGSMRDIAGISSANGRVVGLMPHPEHATEALTGPLRRRARPVLLRPGPGAGRLGESGRRPNRRRATADLAGLHR